MRSYRLIKARPVLNQDPLVRVLFSLMHKQQVGIIDMAVKSGINKNTMKDWRTRTNPRVKDMQACLQVLGFELVARRIKRRPGSIR